MSEKIWRSGNFVWRELMVPDVKQALAFYGELLGWTYQAMDFGGSPYTVVQNPRKDLGGIGGITQTPSGSAAKAAWMSYLSTKNMGETIDRLRAAGGRVLMGPQKIPGVGDFAMAADATEAVFALLCSDNGDGLPLDRPPIGSFCWETLMLTDFAASDAFYKKVFGWTQSAPAADGKGGIYSAGDAMVADFEPTQPGQPSSWMTHVVVEKLDVVRARVEGLGGKILAPEIPVPGFGTMCVIQDPAGATLSLFQSSMGVVNAVEGASSPSTTPEAAPATPAS